MTKAQAHAAIRAMGPGLVLRIADGEFRVSYSVALLATLVTGGNMSAARGKAEATAYYTNDADDAVGTARAMLAKLRSDAARDGYQF